MGKIINRTKREEYKVKKVTLIAEKRLHQIGKGKARTIRISGETPGVLYVEQGDSIPIKVPTKDFISLIKKHGQNAIFYLTMDGSERQVFIKEIQRDPVKNDPIHFDLQTISMNETIRLNVPIQIEGLELVEGRGGIVQRQLQEIEVEAFPNKIPKTVKVDISNLDSGDSVHVGDLEPIEGVNFLSSPYELILTIAEPRLEDDQKIKE